jgi:hypothetical protein
VHVESGEEIGSLQMLFEENPCRNDVIIRRGTATTPTEN